LALIQLCYSPNAHIDVLEQAIWALGNIAGGSVKMRDLILSHQPVKIIS